MPPISERTKAALAAAKRRGVKLGGPRLAAVRIAVAALDLRELIDELPRATVEIVHDGLTLSVEAEPRLALLIGRHSVIRHTTVYRLCKPFRG